MFQKFMNCIFNCEISEELRKELAEGKLQEYAHAASFHELRGEAMLELGYLDIELNINSLEEEEDDIEEATPTLDYFICVKHGDDRDDWESYGYADDYIGDAGQAHVDWGAKNWKELLFADMLNSLVLFANTMRAKHNLTFLSANGRVF